MNNETRKKAEEYINKEIDDYNYYSCHPPMNMRLHIRKLKEILALLQNEEEEGGEVVLCNHEISCPSCTVIFSWKGICDKPKECICGQKLIWPKEKKGEG